MPELKWAPSPAWLVELQAGFGEVIREPLDRSTGSLGAAPARYSAALVDETKPSPALSASDRLSVYNRQYWFRLFTVLQQAFPLVTRLLGYWELNRLASLYVTAHAPSGWDLDDVAVGFVDFLRSTVSGDELALEHPARSLPTAALLQAAAIDAAHQRVLRAPEQRAYSPSAEDATRLMGGQLQFSRAAELLLEDWALVELRRHVSTLKSEEPVQLGERLPTPRSWLLLRRHLTIGLFELEAREAELLSLLREGSVGDSLARLEAACPPAERGSLPERTRGWLTRSVRLGLWTGLDFAPK